jgi:transglutaminase-like putative cysteine protease
VTSDDIRVRSQATRVTRGLVDPWQKASAINRWVHQNVRDKNFRIAFAAASEVARNLSGDCTEHSVLAAAMCRAVGVPARVAVGLIYVDEHEGFGFHMWDEVFVNNRWVAIDPSWDQTTVDAVHIKLSDSSLDGVAPFEAFLPVAAVVGKITIEPVEVR